MPYTMAHCIFMAFCNTLNVYIYMIIQQGWKKSWFF